MYLWILKDEWRFFFSIKMHKALYFKIDYSEIYNLVKKMKKVAKWNPNRHKLSNNYKLKKELFLKYCKNDCDLRMLKITGTDTCSSPIALRAVHVRIPDDSCAFIPCSVNNVPWWCNWWGGIVVEWCINYYKENKGTILFPVLITVQCVIGVPILYMNHSNSKETPAI